MTGLKINCSNENLEIELNIATCKIYLTVFEKLFTATRGISVLKRKYLEKKKRRLDAKKRLDDFLLFQGDDYHKHRERDYVALKWATERVKDSLLQRVAVICDEQREVRRYIEQNVLAYITRFGW